MGILLFGFGLFTAIHPRVMEMYGLTLAEPEARILVRALLGGGETALGLVLIFGRSMGAPARALNAMAALLFVSVGSVRLLSAGVEGLLYFGSQAVREGIIELVLGLACLVAMSMSPQE